MKANDPKGFTIVELMVGIVAAAIVALTAGVMLANTWGGWFRNMAVADMEREAAVAIHTLDLAVRGGAVVSNAAVDSLRVQMPSNGVMRSFYVQTSGGRRSLVYNPNWPNGGGQVLVNGRLGAFVATNNNSLVQVTMTLIGLDQRNHDTGVRMSITNIIHMRNVP